MQKTHADMEDNIYLASNYRLVAVNFWESAKKLEKFIKRKKDGTPEKLTAVPFYFLISHAAELLLKSALLKRGCSESELIKQGYRHNLVALLEELQKKEIKVTDETIKILNGLHTQHKSHALRYKFLINPYMPPASLIDKMLEELLLLTRISTQGK